MMKQKINETINITDGEFCVYVRQRPLSKQ